MVDPTPFAMPDPEALAALESDALTALLDQAVSEFDSLSQADQITADDLSTLRTLREQISAIRAESEARTAAAAEALAEIEALRTEVHGEADPEDPDAPEVDPDAPAEEADPEAPADPEAVAVDAPPADAGDVVTPELVTASARPLNMAAVRARQPRQQLPAAPAGPALPVIRASSDVPGLATGQTLTMEDLREGTNARAQGLKMAQGRATALIASIAVQYPESLQVNDPSSVEQGTETVLHASSQNRLDGGDLVASGGWCSPSETIYDIADVACPDMLWQPPEIQLNRGGVNFYVTPTLDISALTWIHTEAADIAGATKPCFTIPCPDPVPVRCAAYGVCLETGILTSQFFPELTNWYLRNAMVAHEIQISRQMFVEAIAASTHVQGQTSFAAFTAVFGQVALQTADLIEKHSLCETTAVEVVFPWWARNLFLTDIARQNGMSVADIDPQIINRAFASLGVNLQYARGISPAVPTDIGGASPAPAWPDEVNFLIHPAGAFQVGRGPQINLGAIYDSVKFATNDHTALFTEECVALVPRGPESRFVTVPVCPDGTTGAINIGTEVVCPIDAGSVVS